jgi:hypothetical protein
MVIGALYAIRLILEILQPFWLLACKQIHLKLMNTRVAFTLGGGVVGRHLGGTVGEGIGGGIVSWNGSWCIGGFTGGILDGRMDGGALGMKLLVTTVSSLSSLSERMWNGLLLHVRRR